MNNTTQEVQTTDLKKRSYKITFILVNGGHCTEALGVAKLFDDDVEKSYITFKGDNITKSKIKDKGEMVEVTCSFQEVLRDNPLKLLLRLPTFLLAVFEGIRAMKELNPHAVVSTGSGPAIPIMMAAKLTGKKVIYVESMARISSRSLTGVVAYHFLADQFFIQWPEQKLLYPNAIYQGRVL